MASSYNNIDAKSIHHGGLYIIRNAANYMAANRHNQSGIMLNQFTDTANTHN
jgi:hypothetical protein